VAPRRTRHRDTSVPLIEGHYEFGHGEGFGANDLVLRLFSRSMAGFTVGRSHHELARRYDDHHGTVLGAFPERVSGFSARSASSAFNRRASNTSMPPYLALHL
jgi:hypothetical protein